MKVVFRVDGSTEIGSGHLMRCLCLADALTSRAKIVFICRTLTAGLEQLINARGYSVKILPGSSSKHEGGLFHASWLKASQQQDAIDSSNVIIENGGCDWLVLDHYALDYRYEKAMRAYTSKILVIDDLADRAHDCDILVDQNLYADMFTRYIGKVPGHCQCLLGSEYTFLRDEFLQERANARIRRGKVRSILIFYGGVDNLNYTQEAIEVLVSQVGKDIWNRNIKVNVVVSSMHPNIELIEMLCNIYGLQFHIQTNKMAVLMAQSDVALGAGGVSTFERLYMRLPALITPVAENQREPLIYMASLGCFKIYYDRFELKNLLQEVLNDGIADPPDCVSNGVPTLVEMMLKVDKDVQLQRLNALDIRRTFRWLKDEKLRRDFQLLTVPTRRQHFMHWRNLFTNNSHSVFSIYIDRNHVGNCGLKNIDNNNKTSELWIYIGEARNHGKGYAKKAIQLLKKVAVKELRQKKLYLHVSKNNIAAIRLYRSTGFVEVGEKLMPPWESRELEIYKMECFL